MTVLNKGFEYKTRLNSNVSGLKLIDFLIRYYSGFSFEVWMERIESGRVLLDGIPAKGDTILQSGQVLSWIRPPWEEPEVPLSFAILYRDEYLLAVAKPEGLPTIPGGGDFMEHTLLYLVRRHIPEAKPLHRLGRGTSGIVLFALTRESASKISQALENRRILKVYRALASGHPDSNEFEIETPIGPVPHPVLKTIHAASFTGKPAHSHIIVLEHREGCSLLQIRITTGRPHQIRIHCAASGYPLAGDPLYIAGGVPAKNSRALPSDLGYHLHNMLLGFPHPKTGKWTEVACAPPPLLRLHNEITRWYCTNVC